MRQENILSEALEDYLETIYRIIEQKKGVRVKDIAASLKVRNSSVTSALHQLTKDGYIDYEPYGVISLTEKGEVSAKKILQRHRVLSHFFSQVLHISQDLADSTACQMEHAMDESVFKRFLLFVSFLNNQLYTQDSIWNEKFIEFCEKNEENMNCPELAEEYINANSEA